MKGNSNSKKTTEEKKNEKKMTNADLMQFLGKYDSIINDKMISDNAKKVLSCLLYVGSKQNESFTIGQRTISELTGVAKNKISANIAILVDKGFINCNVGERGKNSEYSINYEAMKSYVSLSVPSVPKCTEKVSQVSQSVPSVPNNEGTVRRTVEGTPKDAEIQRVMERIEVYQKCINEELGTLKKIILGDININNNINNNINLKYNILNNDNTEGNNTEEKNNIKEKYTKDNLEILKENSKDEISNDEDIQSENESLNEIENTSNDKLLDNENPNNENNIPSDEKDNSKVESSKNEISNDENTLNENYDFSILENMYLNEGPSVESQINEIPKDIPQLDIESMEREFWGEDTELRATNSSKENEDLNENSKDDISTDENSKDEILEYSIFGDEIPQDNENSNTVKFIDGKFQVVEQVKDKINLNLSEMKNSKEKSQMIENENFNVFGKLQSYRDMNSGRVEGYQFNAYDNLTAAKDYSKSFHASVLCLNLESSELKASVSDTGTWGMLSRKDGVYSFTASNTDISGCKYIAQQRSLSLEKKGGAAADNENTPNNGTQATKTAAVDNHTTEGEIIAPEQSQIANKASECNNDTTANDKEDEKVTETVYADDKNAEVDNYTVNTEITAGNSVKMRPEPSDSNTNTTDTPNNALQAHKTSEVDSNTTNTEKVDSTQSQITNKASNHNTDACYDMYGISTDELNDIIGHHHVNGKGAWRNMKIRLHNDETTISKALEHFKDKKEDGKEFMECHTFFYYYSPICIEIDRLIREGKMTEEQKNDCITIFGKLTRGKFAYWHKVFTTRPPRPNFPSEQEMWKLLGCPQVTNKTVHKTDKVVNNNKVYEDNVVLPTDKDFESMSLDEIKNTLLTFVAEHPNLSDDKKAYINNLCIAYTLEPQYVA